MLKKKSSALDLQCVLETAKEDLRLAKKNGIHLNEKGLKQIIECQTNIKELELFYGAKLIQEKKKEEYPFISFWTKSAKGEQKEITAHSQNKEWPNESTPLLKK